MASADDATTGWPLAPMQAGMLFEFLLHRGDPKATFERGYNIEQLCVRVEEPLVIDKLRAAWAQVMQRHHALTARFEWAGLAKPVQWFCPEVTVPIEVVEVAADEEFNDLLRRDRERGFDLAVAPLMRVTVVRHGGHQELIWTFHHILLDGRSFATVLVELFAIYDAMRAGQAVELPAPQHTYSDFLRWVSQRDVEPSREHFRSLLSEMNTSTVLPGAESAQRPLSRRGYAEHRRHLSKEQTDQIRGLALQTQTSVATVLQCAWALVLGCFGQDRDVIFGTTRACRRSALDGATDDIVGLFINTLPLRVNVQSEQTIAELLQSLREQNLALRRHEHTQLAEIQSQSGLSNHSPLFQTLVMFENRELNQTLRERGGERWALRHCELHEQPSLPLSVTIFESDHLEFRLIFDRSRFTDRVIDRLAACLETAAVGLCGDLSRSPAEVDVIPPSERAKILYEWNATEKAFASDLCIHELFEHQVELQPNVPALEFERDVFSYRDLDTWTNRLARVLVARGAGPGKYVGVCLNRGAYLVAVLLAVAKSGAAYVPLDPDYPEQRLQFMLQDAAAVLIVTEEEHKALFSLPLIVVDGADAAEIKAQDPSRLSRQGSSRDVCYSIFTSGSTGRPKGVVLTHTAVVNTLEWVNRTFQVSSGDRLLFVTSPCFDLSVYDIFGALGAGATVVVASAAQLKNASALAKAIVDQQITIWDSAPAALQRLESFFPSADTQSALRLVMLSGDWIPLSLPGAVSRAFPKAVTKSLGGATEAAIWSNWFDVGELDPRWTSIPYGRPIQNAQYYVLDERMEPVPVGVPGDLFIGGVCLAQGYLNRAELTAERFVPNVFEPFNPAARLYRTGDLARYFEDGNLEFLGRADFQVKIRGFRVELGEVEAALLEMRDLKEVVCTSFVDASGQRALVAYVVRDGGERIDLQRVRAHLGSRVPDFMVPSYVVELGALPLSANGKVDRKALPSPLEQAPRSMMIGARNPVERKMLAIWQRVLKRQALGVRDNFFDLGGHSLLAVALMSEIRKEFGFEIPLSRIVEFPTIEALVALINPEEEEKIPKRTLIQSLRVAGPKPLFLVHDGDGEILLYRELAQLLPSSYSTYGIQPDEMPGVPLAQITINDMAARYVAEVRTLQPEGPYYLGGLCAGGVIAFEMARQLVEAGQTVELVALMDAVEPTVPKKPFLETRRRLGRARRLWQRARGNNSMPPSSRWVNMEPHPTDMTGFARTFSRKAISTLTYEMNSFVDSVSAELRTALLRAVRANGWGWPTGIPSLSVRQIYSAAKRRYVPQPAAIKVVLLLKATQGRGADEPLGGLTNDPCLGWSRFVSGELEAVDVPGGHSSMLQRPYVSGLARVLAMYLDPLSASAHKSRPPPNGADRVSSRPPHRHDLSESTLRESLSDNMPPIPLPPATVRSPKA